MAEIIWKSILTKLVGGDHFTAGRSEWFVDDLMQSNANPATVGTALAIQRQLGLTADEVRDAAKAVVSHAVPLNVSGGTTDTVGTDGDGFVIVNLSTVDSVAVTTTGVKIVKYGNRAAPSECGTVNVLEGLGLPLDLKPEAVGGISNEVGIAFAFARTSHPAIRFVGPIRAALDIPCVFSTLGPLANPASPAHVAIGYINRRVSPTMAAVYASRGQSDLVYTPHEGMDELAPIGPISVWEARDGKVIETEFDPAMDPGLVKITADQLEGGVPDVNANAFKDFLAGKDVTSRTTTLLNAASAIVAGGNLVDNGTLIECFAGTHKLAEDAIGSGKAKVLFNKWIETAKSKAWYGMGLPKYIYPSFIINYLELQEPIDFSS